MFFNVLYCERLATHIHFLVMDVTELFIKRTCWSRILGWPSDKTKWHHSLWCWWVQKVKVNQIINAQFLQGQHLHWFESNIKICVKLNLFCAIPKWFGSDFSKHHHAQIGAQDLWICLLRQLCREGLFSTWQICFELQNMQVLCKTGSAHILAFSV